MKLSALPKTVIGKKKRLGRGYGSGVGGHTVGRGQKGQKTRGKMPLWFEGGQLPIVRRTPYIKGKHRFQSLSLAPIAVNFDFLSKYFQDGEEVSIDSLSKAFKLNEKDAKAGFKIIKTGKLEKSLTVSVKASKGAIKEIEAKGGKYTLAQ